MIQAFTDYARHAVTPLIFLPFAKKPHGGFKETLLKTCDNWRHPSWTFEIGCHVTLCWIHNKRSLNTKTIIEKYIKKTKLPQKDEHKKFISRVNICNSDDDSWGKIKYSSHKGGEFTWNPNVNFFDWIIHERFYFGKSFY